MKKIKCKSSKLIKAAKAAKAAKVKNFQKPPLYLMNMDELRDEVLSLQNRVAYFERCARLLHTAENSKNEIEINNHYKLCFMELREEYERQKR